MRSKLVHQPPSSSKMREQCFRVGVLDEKIGRLNSGALVREWQLWEPHVRFLREYTGSFSIIYEKHRIGYAAPIVSTPYLDCFYSKCKRGSFFFFFFLARAKSAVCPRIKIHWAFCTLRPSSSAL